MTTIDPLQSLSFSIASNPKVYALLLGSGVSRSAGILTGWEIVIDLLGKLSASEGASSVTDLEEWYRQKYSAEPDYSGLLDALARTPAERQQLLRPYFEPNEDEREQGLKRPTAAHRAIARMVADGLIRLIITTNFDQLIEVALREEGIAPTVLTAPDQVAGALPLIHTDCCVLKVHGDYLDPRILNSPSELSAYEPEVDRLLDQIFDEFGLIVCGWSGEWDEALRSAIVRAPTRRFTTFWASRGDLGAESRKVVERRGAQVIHIEDADKFFTEMQATVASIVGLSRPHPLSTQAAVETMKRYMVSHEHRIRLADHIGGTIIRLEDTINGDAFPMQTDANQDRFVERLRSYESACSTLMAMGTVAGYWAEDEHFQNWERSILRIYVAGEMQGNRIWSDLRNYPTLLAMYALGIGAVASGRLAFLGRLLDISANRRMWGRDRSTVLEGSIMDLFDIDWSQWLPNKRLHHTPFNDHLHEVLRESCNQLMINEQEYTSAFDKLEILAGLSVGHRRPERWQWFPVGSFLHRGENRQRVLREIKDSLETSAGQSQFVRCGIFGSSSAECLETLQNFEQFVGRVASQRGIWTPIY